MPPGVAALRARCRLVGACRLARHSAHCRADATARAGSSYRRRSRAAWEAPAGPCGTHPVAGGSTSVGTSRAPVPRNGGHGVPKRARTGCACWTRLAAHEGGPQPPGSRDDLARHSRPLCAASLRGDRRGGRTRSGHIPLLCLSSEPAGYLSEAMRRAIATPGTVTPPRELAGARPPDLERARVPIHPEPPTGHGEHVHDRSEVDANACPASTDPEHRHAYVGDRVGERSTGLQRSVGWSGQGSGVEQDRV